jgi:hypothetical protein
VGGGESSDLDGTSGVVAKLEIHRFAGVINYVCATRVGVHNVAGNDNLVSHINVLERGNWLHNDANGTTVLVNGITVHGRVHGGGALVLGGGAFVTTQDCQDNFGSRGGSGGGSVGRSVGGSVGRSVGRSVGGSVGRRVGRGVGGRPGDLALVLQLGGMGNVRDGFSPAVRALASVLGGTVKSKAGGRSGIVRPAVVRGRPVCKDVAVVGSGHVGGGVGRGVGRGVGGSVGRGVGRGVGRSGGDEKA